MFAVLVFYHRAVRFLLQCEIQTTSQGRMWVNFAQVAISRHYFDIFISHCTNDLTTRWVTIYRDDHIGKIMTSHDMMSSPNIITTDIRPGYLCTARNHAPRTPKISSIKNCALLLHGFKSTVPQRYISEVSLENGRRVLYIDSVCAVSPFEECQEKERGVNLPFVLGQWPMVTLVCPRSKIFIHSQFYTNTVISYGLKSTKAVKWVLFSWESCPIEKQHTHLSLSTLAACCHHHTLKSLKSLSQEFIKTSSNTCQHISKCVNVHCQSVRESLLTCWFPLARSRPGRLNGVHLPWKVRKCSCVQNPIVCAVSCVFKGARFSVMLLVDPPVEDGAWI